VVLRLHGSNTIGARLAPALAEDFLKLQGAKEVRTVIGSKPEETTVQGTLPGNAAPTVIEIRSHGSATAFEDLLARKTDIGLSSRRISSEEMQKLGSLGDLTAPGSEHILALDGIAIIVNRDNPIDALTREQIGKIFAGEINNWSLVDGPEGAIKVYARDDKSGTFDSFRSLVLGGRKLVASVIRFEDSNLLSDAVARDPGGIGFIGLPYVRDAKAIAVSEPGTPPLLPNRLTVATEDYLLSRRLFLYTLPDNQNPWVGRFIDFAISHRGQNVVDAEGFVAQTIRSEVPPAAQNAPEE
jgi:phosphate transport system substrate-binding protein